MFARLTSHLPRFLENAPRWWKKDCLHGLPDDILMHIIREYFTLPEVLHFRQVDRRMYRLTCEAHIWKRFLAEHTGPLPPLPPSASHALGRLSALEAERLLVRGISADDNFRRTQPRLHRAAACAAQRDVHELFLVPGGQYMLAGTSVSGGEHWALTLFVLDHKWGAAVPLASIPTQEKAYNIRAVFAQHQSENDGRMEGLIVSYQRRFWKHGGGPPTVDLKVSDFNTEYDIDTPWPLVWSTNVHFIPLYALEIIQEREAPPVNPSDATQAPPFLNIAALSTDRLMEHSQVEEIDGVSWVGMVMERQWLYFKNIATGAHVELWPDADPQYPDATWELRAFCFVPEQRLVLIIRCATEPEDNGVFPTALEYYALPEPEPADPKGKAKARTPVDEHASRKQAPLERAYASYGRVDRATFAPRIPDVRPRAHTRGRAGLGERDQSAAPDLAAFTAREPGPISVFLTCTDPPQIAHVAIWPRRVEYPPTPPTPTTALPSSGADTAGPAAEAASRPRWHWPLRALVHQTWFAELAKLGWGVPRVLPGANRAVYVSLAPGDRTAAPALGGLWGYAAPETRDPHALGALHAPDEDPQAAHVQARERYEATRIKNAHVDTLATLPMHGATHASLRAQGLSAAAFDETTSRVVCADAGSETIYILDYAAAPRMGEEEYAGLRLPIMNPA